MKSYLLNNEIAALIHLISQAKILIKKNNKQTKKKK